MKSKQRFHGMVYFLAGVAVTLAVTFGFLSGQDVRAANACSRTSLVAINSAGDIPGPEFRVLYDIPSCIKDYGYTVDRVAKTTGGRVSVEYKKN